MNVFESIILGLTQGLTEFIPVSSSGHLLLMQNLMAGASDHLFLEFINIGTLLALLIFFRQKIIKIVKDIFVNKNYRLARNVLVTAIPAGIAGLLLSDIIGTIGFFNSVITVVFAIGVVGLVMIVVDKLPRLSKVRDGEKLSWERALSIGVAQVLALIPGVSRSGSTIVAGRLSGLDNKAAAEYSFLASIPIMMGVTLKMLVSSSSRAYFAQNSSALIISNIVALVAGLLAVSVLMKFLEKKHSLQLFGWYRVVLALVLGIVLLL
jgi:Uncharacterized bacitracin resistance protein